MKMTKKQFRIGELADRLQVKRFVIRFWEKEFELSASRSTGKQRFYTEEDYTTFSTIKQLLYSEKFTISGAKKQLSAEKCIPSTRSTTTPSATAHNTTARSTTVRSTGARNASAPTTPIHNTQTLAAEKNVLEHHATAHMDAHIATLTNQMIQLREKLIKLNELL
jgi:DNA-binding transcriptional MerR regulator